MGEESRISSPKGTFSLQSQIATAPGKIILFGEHAVVYGRPAIAVPVFQVHAQATVDARDDGKVVIEAIDLHRKYELSEAREGDPLATIIRLTCARLNVEAINFTVQIQSTVPIGGGLGSGAAVSVAIARALADFVRAQHFSTEFPSKNAAPLLGAKDISALAYEVEKLHHGTPSGIDNTVIAFEQPVYFIKSKPIESFRVAQPFTIAIADTGVAAPTKIAVGDVRRAWEKNRAKYESLFDNIGEIARKARKAIEDGEVNRLGALMRQNQILLRQIGVSSADIERLVLAATTAGARGAKLSGGGRGGNVIALVDDETRGGVERAWMRAGAKRVIITGVA